MGPPHCYGYLVANLNIDLDSIMGFRTHMIEKIRQLVRIHYQLDKNSFTYLRNLREDWAFLDLNPNEVYTIGNIK